MPASSNAHASEIKTLPELAPLEAVLFDIDEKLCQNLLHLKQCYLILMVHSVIQILFITMPSVRYLLRKTLPKLAPLEAVLFDIDGTLCDSDPIHYHAFREMFIEIGYNNGIPITEEFYAEKINGKHNDYLGKTLFSDWSFEKCTKFLNDKEAMFRRLAPQQLKAAAGLFKLCRWIEDHGLKCAVVTNAPRLNAELMISILGLKNFFQVVVLGCECERAKPFPDPYLRALKKLNASPEHTIIFEDSVDGVKAGVAAGMPVVGVATKNPVQSLINVGASLIIKDFEDLKIWTGP